MKEALGDPSDFFRALFSWKGLDSVRFPYVLPSGAKKTLAGIISENAVFSGWGVSPDGEPSFEVGTVDETVIHRAALFLSGDFPYYAGHFDKYAFSVAARKFTEGALSHADFKEISDFCPRDYEFFKSAINAVIRAVDAKTPSEKAEAFFSFVVGELGLKLPADVFGGRRSAEIN